MGRERIAGSGFQTLERVSQLKRMKHVLHLGEAIELSRNITINAP